MTPVETFLETFGPMVVINLQHRRDRLAEFRAQLAAIGLSTDHPNVVVFEAIRPDDAAGFPNIGARGCFMSHLGVLEQIMAAGGNSVIVCEDDLDFAPDFAARCTRLISEPASVEWDLFYGGYETDGNIVSAQPGSETYRADPMIPFRCTHFYLVRGPAIAALAGYLRLILSRAPGDPAGGPMHVDGAIGHFRADHPGFVTLAAVPPLGNQRSSRTDIHTLQWFDRLPLIRDLVGVMRRML